MSFVTTTVKKALFIAETSINLITESAIAISDALESTSAESEKSTSAATQTDVTGSSLLNPDEWPPYTLGDSHPIRDLRKLIGDYTGLDQDVFHDALNKVLAARGHEECMTAISNHQKKQANLKLKNVELERIIGKLKADLAILNSAYMKGAEERTTLESELFELRETCD